MLRFALFSPLMKDHLSSKTTICVNHTVVSEEGDYCIANSYYWLLNAPLIFTRSILTKRLIKFSFQFHITFVFLCTNVVLMYIDSPCILAVVPLQVLENLPSEMWRALPSVWLMSWSMLLRYGMHVCFSCYGSASDKGHHYILSRNFNMNRWWSFNYFIGTLYLICLEK